MNVPAWVPTVAMVIFTLAMIFGIIQRFMMVSRAGYGATFAYVLIVGGLAGIVLIGAVTWYRKQVTAVTNETR